VDAEQDAAHTHPTAPTAPLIRGLQDVEAHISNRIDVAVVNFRFKGHLQLIFSV